MDKYFRQERPEGWIVHRKKYILFRCIDVVFNLPISRYFTDITRKYTSYIPEQIRKIIDIKNFVVKFSNSLLGYLDLSNRVNKA